MKTHTSKKAIYLRTLLLLPLMALLLYGFSETKLIETAPILSEQVIQESFENQIDLTENIQININKKGQLLVQDELVALDDLKNFLSKINAHLSTQQKQKVVRSFIYVEAETPKKIISEVNQIITDYGAATINVVGVDSPIAKKSQEGASRKLMAEYNALAKKYNAMLSKSKSIQIKMKDVDRLEHIHSLMSEKQKADAEPFPDFPPMPSPLIAAKALKTLKEPKAPKAPKAPKGKNSDIPPPPSTSNDEEIVKRRVLLKEAKIREQDVLIKKHESKLAEHEILMETEVARMEQKEILMAQQESKMQEQEVKVIEQQAELKEIEKEIQRVSQIKRGAEANIPEPPTPPLEPIKPVDSLIEMAKNDAKFYFEGKAISSNKAVVLVKNNGEMNIDTRKSKGKQEIVRLSTESIAIGN